MALTDQQRKYAEARLAGLSIRDSALAAGCPEKSASQAGSRLEKHPNVLAHLERLKSAESDSVPAAGRDAPNPNTASAGQFYDDPKEMLRAAMNDRLLDPKTRLQAAIALMPFEHQRLGEGGKKEGQQKSAEGAVTGRFAPAAPPRTAQLSLIK